MKASVIIPNFRDWERLSICLSRLERQTIPAKDFEIIVSNNDPIENPPAELRIPDNARIIPAPTPGSYAARNAAIEMAVGDILAFTDADCVPSVNWLEEGIKFFDSNHSFHLLGGDVRPVCRGANPSAVELYDHIFNINQKDYVISNNVAATANLFARRSLVDEIGPFDPHRMSGGDFEFCNRAHKHGFKIGFSKEAYVEHPMRSKVSDVILKTRRTFGGKIYQKRKNGRRFLIPPFDRIVPSARAAQKIFRRSDVNLVTGVKVYSIHYLSNLARFYEHIRITVLKKDYERR